MRITVDLREAVIALARQAGAAIMEVYEKEFDVTHKEDASPLTAADLAAHRIIVEGLEKLTPDLPVLSEESADVPWETRRHWPSYWLVDPLDGTREFVKRNGEFSVNIALIVQGAPTLGVVQSPVGGQVWHAVRGEQAYRRDGWRDEPEALEVVPWKLQELEQLMLRDDFSEGRSLAALFIARAWLAAAR